MSTVTLEDYEFHKKLDEAIEFLEAENIIRRRSAIDKDILDKNYNKVIFLLRQMKENFNYWEK